MAERTPLISTNSSSSVNYTEGSQSTESDEVSLNIVIPGGNLILLETIHSNREAKCNVGTIRCCCGIIRANVDWAERRLVPTSKKHDPT